jgi:hypothetical protein
LTSNVLVLVEPFDISAFLLDHSSSYTASVIAAILEYTLVQWVWPSAHSRNLLFYLGIAITHLSDSLKVYSSLLPDKFCEQRPWSMREVHSLTKLPIKKLWLTDLYEQACMDGYVIRPIAVSTCGPWGRNYCWVICYVWWPLYWCYIDSFGRGLNVKNSIWSSSFQANILSINDSVGQAFHS